MPSDVLRVNTTHLRELASHHGQTAAEMSIAAERVAGVHRRIRISHGDVASPTAVMIKRVEQLRCAAGHRIAAISGMLSDDLATAAHNYDTTDHASGARADGILW